MRIAFWFVVAAQLLGAQAGKKVYISVDMEGISGISGPDMQFQNSLIPEIAEAFPGMERPAPDTVAFARDTMPAAYRELRVLYRYINPN